MLKRAAQLAVQYGDDGLILAGCVLFLYGLSLLNPIFSWLVGGLMLIVFGVLLGRAKSNAN